MCEQRHFYYTCSTSGTSIQPTVAATASPNDRDMATPATTHSRMIETWPRLPQPTADQNDRDMATPATTHSRPALPNHGGVVVADTLASEGKPAEAWLGPGLGAEGRGPGGQGPEAGTDLGGAELGWGRGPRAEGCAKSWLTLQQGLGTEAKGSVGQGRVVRAGAEALGWGHGVGQAEGYRLRAEDRGPRAMC